MIGLTFFTLTSCEKENFNDTSKEQKTKGFKILSYGNAGSNSRGVENNILSFDSEEEFDATLDSLETVYNDYSLEFSRSVEGMSDEEVNNKIKNENIDLEKPLTDFENQYEFVSLRNKIDQKEKEWLANPNPDFTLCPQVHSIATFSERCLWNENGEIMIAGKIYKYSDDDTKYIKILDGDFVKLALINSGNTAVLSDPMVAFEIILPENSSTTVTATSMLNCTSTSGNSVIFPLQANYRVVCSNRLKEKSWSLGKHSLSAGIVAYKRNVDFFERYVTVLNLNLNGQRFQNCGNTPTLVSGLSKTNVLNSAASVELKRNYKISTKYNQNSSSINSYHAAGFVGVNYFPPFQADLRLKY